MAESKSAPAASPAAAALLPTESSIPGEAFKPYADEPLNLRLLASRLDILALLLSFEKLDGALKNGAVVEIPRRQYLRTRNLRRYLSGESDSLV